MMDDLPRCADAVTQTDPWQIFDTGAIAEILHGQTQILQDLFALKAQQDSLATYVMYGQDEMDRKIVDFKVYTDNLVRGVESKVFGLTSVVDNLQQRLLEDDLDDTSVKSVAQDSTSSLSSLEDSLITDHQNLSNVCKNINVGSMEGETGEVLLESLQTQNKYQNNKGRSWLRQNHVDLVRGFDPSNCMLLHSLIGADVISDTDEDEILSHRTRKDRARELLLKITRCSEEKYNRFLKELDKEFPHLASLPLRDSETGEDVDKIECIVCHLIHQVNVCDVIDVIYQHDIIDKSLYERVWRESCPKKKWIWLLKAINCYRRFKGIGVLTQALAKKYPSISERLGQSRLEILKCCCKRSGEIFNRSSVISSGRCGPFCSRVKSVLPKHFSKHVMYEVRQNRFTKLYRIYRRSRPTEVTDCMT